MYVGQLAEKRIRTIHLQRNPYVCTIPWSSVIVMKIVTGWSEKTPEDPCRFDYRKKKVSRDKKKSNLEPYTDTIGT